MLAPDSVSVPVLLRVRPDTDVLPLAMTPLIKVAPAPDTVSIRALLLFDRLIVPESVSVPGLSELVRVKELAAVKMPLNSMLWEPLTVELALNVVMLGSVTAPVAWSTPLKVKAPTPRALLLPNIKVLPAAIVVAPAR